MLQLLKQVLPRLKIVVSHAHKIQAAVAMEQRAREMGKTAEAAVYRAFINTMKKKTKQMNENKKTFKEFLGDI